MHRNKYQTKILTFSSFNHHGITSFPAAPTSLAGTLSLNAHTPISVNRVHRAYIESPKPLASRQAIAYKINHQRSSQ